MATFERLRAILRDPSRRTSFVNARSYLLSGYLFCSECQRPLRARPRGDKVRRYVCATGPMAQGCGAIAILAQPTEELVSEMLIDFWSKSPEVAAGLADQPDTDLGSEAAALAADREKLTHLAADYANDEITRPEWQAAKAALNERINARTARLSQTNATAVLGPLRGPGVDVRAIWSTLGFDQQRAVIGATFDRIVIGRAVKGRNFFDPERVSVEWRA